MVGLPVVGLATTRMGAAARDTALTRFVLSRLTGAWHAVLTFL